MPRRRRHVGNPLIAVGYVRVSTEDQNLGPEAQRDAITSWSARFKVQLIEVFVDHGVSGGAPIERRPALLSALEALRAHDAGLFVAAKRDRLARDVAIAATIECAVVSAGAILRTTDGASDGAGPEGMMMRGIFDLFAHYERGVIKARTRSALAIKKSRNERTGTIPYGFRLSADGVHLEEDPGEQAVIALVLALRSEGRSQRGIAAELATRGLLSRVGTPLSQTQIARLLIARGPHVQSGAPSSR